LVASADKHEKAPRNAGLFRAICPGGDDVRLFALGINFLLLVFVHFLMVGSWLASPVVRVVVAGGPVLGTEVYSGVVFAGRVAVAPGGWLVWAATS
jgi:hypothetical protein